MIVEEDEAVCPQIQFGGNFAYASGLIVPADADCAEILFPKLHGRMPVDGLQCDLWIILTADRQQDTPSGEILELNLKLEKSAAQALRT